MNTQVSDQTRVLAQNEYLVFPKALAIDVQVKEDLTW